MLTIEYPNGWDNLIQDNQLEKLPRQTNLNSPPPIGSFPPPSQKYISLCLPHHFHSQNQTTITNPKMASTSALSMALPLPRATHKNPTTAGALFRPLPSKAVAKPIGKFQVKASLKEKVVTGLTVAALTASLIVPEAAEAAVSPSLKNFLLSIGAGTVVVVAIIGAVVGVSNFDPVKRS